jgi:hypothetical protein
MFLSCYLVTRRKPTKPLEETENNLSIGVEDYSYYFAAGHCVEGLAHLSQDIAPLMD